jgi:flagella basal body P-ring formation protein FlgA
MGQSITLGDLFVGAGDLANRAIAPAPAAGQITTLSMSLVSMAASAAGLDFTPPPNVNDVQVVHPAGARATVRPDNAQTTQVSAQAPLQSGVGEIAVRRGQAVTVVYQVGGITLSTRMQAVENGFVGQSVRLNNPTSSRVVIATVTGPGAASASP